MILISHRGNINGPLPQHENRPSYIHYALSQGYDVEIDIWFKNNKFYLGHDEPSYEINAPLLATPGFWCHAKNIEAIIEMKRLNVDESYDIHFFWHEEDKVTLTSKNYIWAYPGVNAKGSIAVMPEIHNDNTNNRIGICSDYIEKYKIETNK